MDEALKKKLDELTHKSKVMLFIKGTPDMPACGFTPRIVEAVEGQGITYDFFNVLSDPEVFHGLMEYANWPTYPQLWIDGKLVGGCDITCDMAARGELKKMVE